MSRQASVRQRISQQDHTSTKRTGAGPNGIAIAPSTLQNQTGLPDHLKAGVETLSGLSLDDVRVHINSSKPAQLQALAYTQGTDIHLGPGQERHLPHEAWHVVQQKQGRVNPTNSFAETPVNTDQQLEMEASYLGNEAAQSPFPAKAPNTLKSIGAPAQSVVQGVFKYGFETVNTKEAADDLGNTIYENLRKRNRKIVPKITKIDFVKLVVDLATSNQDHGPIDEGYFLRIFTEGRVNENFSFKAEGRRIQTLYESKPNFPPTPSYFQERLSTPKPKKKRGQKQEEAKDELVLDLSYTDLRSILESTLGNSISSEQIDQAIETGVKNFTSTESQITLNPQHNPDLQLIPYHLLKYQSFNRGQLKETDENREENKFRALALEISKRMITTASSNLSLIVPPTPDFSQEGKLRYALPGLIDVNRPLSKSIFGEETYKAVFQLTHQLLRKAYDQAQASLSEKEKERKQPFTITEQIDEQRNFYNKSFFELLPDMIGSTIEEGKGEEYVTKSLRIPYDKEKDSFDEALSDDEDRDLSSDDEIYDSGDSLFRAAEKRSTFLNSFGTLSKLTSYQELLDPQTDENKEKYANRHKRIDRRTKSFNKKYQDRFGGITKELAYVTKKEKLIYKHIDKIKDEITLLEFLIGKEETTGVKALLGHATEDTPFFSEISKFNEENSKNRANTKIYKQALAKLRKDLRTEQIKKTRIKSRIRALSKAQSRANKTLDRLSDFYFDTPVGDVLEERENSSTWKNQYPEVFGRLGEQTLKSYLFKPEKKRQRDEQKSPERKREKKRRKQK